MNLCTICTLLNSRDCACISTVDSMGLSSFAYIQRVTEKATWRKMERWGCSRWFKVIEIGTNRKLVCGLKFLQGVFPCDLELEIWLSETRIPGIPDGENRMTLRLLIFAARCYAIARCLSICPSVRLSVTFMYSVATNKHIFKVFFYHRVATPFQFFRTKHYGKILTGTPLTGASNSSEVGKNRDSTNIWLLDRWLVECEQQLRLSTVQSTAKTARISEYLFITTSMDNHDEEKKTEYICTQR